MQPAYETVKELLPSRTLMDPGATPTTNPEMDLRLLPAQVPSPSVNGAPGATPALAPAAVRPASVSRVNPAGNPYIAGAAGAAGTPCAPLAPDAAGAPLAG